MIDFSLWFIFPVAILISTIAMMSGIGGAVLFSPFLIIVLNLSPTLALASGLLIEIFGFSSGIIGYIKRKVINFSFVKKLLLFSIPGAVLGVVLGQFIPDMILSLILCTLLIYLAYIFLHPQKTSSVKHPHITGHSKEFRLYETDFKTKISTFFGGTLLGLVSSGLGEINEYNFIEKMKMKPSAAAGNSIFIIACSAIVGIISHSWFLFFENGVSNLHVIAPILLFAIPGVIIGAQIGVRLTKRIELSFMEPFLGFLFCIIAAILGLSIVL